MSTDLVERAKGGDHDAFEALVRPAYPRLYAVAFRILRDPFYAEDAVQDAVVGAWRDLRGLRDAARFDAWLYRLLINGCRNRFRTARRRPVEVPAKPIDRASEENPADELARRDELDRAFRRVSVDHRAVLVLAHYMGYSGPEIAAILGIPTGTVHSRLHNAAASLRRALHRPTLPSGTPAEQVP